MSTQLPDSPSLQVSDNPRITPVHKAEAEEASLAEHLPGNFQFGGSLSLPQPANVVPACRVHFCWVPDTQQGASGMGSVHCGECEGCSVLVDRRMGSTIMCGCGGCRWLAGYDCSPPCAQDLQNPHHQSCSLPNWHPTISLQCPIYPTVCTTNGACLRSCSEDHIRKRRRNRRLLCPHSAGGSGASSAQGSPSGSPQPALRVVVRKLCTPLPSTRHLLAAARRGKEPTECLPGARQAGRQVGRGAGGRPAGLRHGVWCSGF